MSFVAFEPGQIGPAGPTGPTGPAGPSGGTGTYTCDPALPLLSAVYISSSGTVAAASAGSASTAPCIGFVVAKVGSSCTVQGVGEVSGFTGLTIDSEYVLSTTTGGIVPIASAPSTPGQIWQRVGTAKTTSVLLAQVDGDFIQL